MRLLNSVCKLLADKYKGVPVYIEELPEGFSRPSFFVTLATESTGLKNLKVYEDSPLYQIVYFSRKNAVGQVCAMDLYKKKEELKALFLLPGAIPVLPEEGVKEKQRFAKVNQLSSEVRLSENSLYSKLSLSFTEDTKQEKEYELMQEVDLVMSKTKNY